MDGISRSRAGRDCACDLADYGGVPSTSADPGVGTISTVVGVGPASEGDGGPATDGRMSHPERIAFDVAGNLYIAERGGHRVRKVDTSGVITTVAGNGSRNFCGDGGQATNACLDTPTGVAVDDANNVLYIADSENRRVRAVDLATGLISTAAGNGSCCFAGDGIPATDAEFNLPTDVAVDTSSNLYIVERHGRRVHMVDALTGIINTVASTGQCCDFRGGGGPAIDAWLEQPWGIEIDANDDLYIVDRWNHRIRKVDTSTGIIDTVAGSGDGGFCGDGGLATDACLDQPTDVAGNGNCCNDGDGGPATSAALGEPTGVEVDSGGNMFISSIERQRVREVDGASCIITTVAGSGPEERFDGVYSGDGGPATNALLASPWGVAVTQSGDLLFTDFMNHVVRMVEGVAATPDADLSVTQADTPDPAILGETVAYNVTVTNNGPSIVADAVLTNILSEASASILSATSQSTQVNCAPEGDAVICDLGRMNVGEQVTIVLLAKPQSSWTFTNTASVTAGREDLDLLNNTSVEETTVELDETAPCTLNLDLGYAGGTLTMNFELGTQMPATWSVWLVMQGTGVIPVWAFPIPFPITSPTTIPISFPLPDLGTIGFLTALSTPEGITCFDFGTVNTGDGSSSGQSIGSIRELFPRPNGVLRGN